jgi:hypothetical protein
MTVTLLQQELRVRGAKVSGRKPELVARLEMLLAMEQPSEAAEFAKALPPEMRHLDSAIINAQVLAGHVPG